MLGVYLGELSHPGGPHWQERLAAGGRDMEETGGASSEPESAGRAGRGRQGMWGQGAGHGHRLAREQNQRAGHAFLGARTVCNLKCPRD